MKKSYVYKIQWIFNANKGDLKNLYNVIHGIGVKSLTNIKFLNSDFKRIGSYSGFISYPSGTAEVETIKAIAKAVKENKDITMIEIYRTN